MKVIIFSGPTLPEDHIKTILPDALVMPPAEQGDIDFARFQLGADIIGLIDGVHTHKLPVLHKEILSVLHDGCRVMGAASMGALRAVECEPFGAEPVGEVARMYQTGEIDADDEVCVAHADKESGYKKLSVPMVNIRATLKNADVTDELKNEIIDYARNLYYPDREWQNIFEACDVNDEQIQGIQDAYCDIKEADALHLCYQIPSSEVKPAAKKIQWSNYGFAQVFKNNDRKIISDGKIIRSYEIADHASNYDCYNARNRALALELCRMLGIRFNLTHPVTYPDLDAMESKHLFNDEISLNKAGEWLFSRAQSSDRTKLLNDFLRISGRYESIKEMIQ